MDPHGKFLPPQNEKEFMDRATPLELPAINSILDTLKVRREELVRNIDAEIDFYQKAKQLKEGTYQPEGSASD